MQVDPELLVLALTHRSFSHEHGGLPTNERLEFLGDSVLGIFVTETLYRRHPDAPEGALSRMRAATVSQRSLARIARSLGIGPYLLLGKGELATGGQDKDSILSDMMEAIVGAVHLCNDVEGSRAFVMRIVGPLLEEVAVMGAGLDWKTSLQELAPTIGVGVPDYVVEAEGPDHARVFTARVYIDGVIRGTGGGTSKKQAEQEAAAEAYRSLSAG